MIVAVDPVAAARYFVQQLGCTAFPVWGSKDGRCNCGDPHDGKTGQHGPDNVGKHPATKHGFKEGTTDVAAIARFLSNPGTPNYGLTAPPGVLVIDVDGPEGLAAWDDLQHRHGPLPVTLTTTTANGRHYFYRWPDDAGPMPTGKLFGFVVRRSDDGYVIGPGSVHPKGVVYDTLRRDDGHPYAIADLPRGWAEAARRPDPVPSSTITVNGRPDPSTVAVGGRHDYLRDTARLFAGTVREPEALLAAVMAVNLRLNEPKTEADVRRAIGEALERFPADPVETDADTGEERRVFSSLGMLGRGAQEDFPADPDPVAFGGLLGEIVHFLAESTDASLMGLMGSLLPVCGALIPGVGYFQRDHPTSPWVALVGESFKGRKGTAINRVTDAISDVVGGAHVLNQTKLGGINSGEGLVSAMERRQLTAGPRGRTCALIVEEEYANLLAAAARENSTLDPKLRTAFDMGQLANVTKITSQLVDPPYWLAALIAITPTELREKVPASALRSGSMNRWLFLPVVKRDVIAGNERPVLPLQIQADLKEARRVSLEERPTIEVAPEVLAEISEYGEFLAQESVGLAADLTRRYPVIAFRIGMIHAAAERSPTVSLGHFQRGVAVTEYARSGIGWVFGYTVGDDLATLLLRHLQDKGELRTNEITQGIIRDPLKRQRAIDELERLGFARVEPRTTGGRRANVLALVDGKGQHHDFRASKGAFVRTKGGGQKNRGDPPARMHESPVSRSDDLHESLHESQKELHGMHESPTARKCPACKRNHPAGTTCASFEEETK